MRSRSELQRRIKASDALEEPLGLPTEVNPSFRLISFWSNGVGSITGMTGPTRRGVARHTICNLTGFRRCSRFSGDPPILCHLLHRGHEAHSNRCGAIGQLFGRRSRKWECAARQVLLMVASGYTMEGVALLLGMTFIAINVYVCINLTHGRLPRELQATPDILPEPHGPYSSAENSAVSGPPDYETACREPQPIPNDDMIAYQPPSTSPPPLATLTSNNTPPKMFLKFYAGTLMVPKCHSHLLATSRLRFRVLSSSALSMEV
uniref:Uncharacterized protein n=1 Tax=Echinococcus granulosus TaxID=6210 RepID=A0A068WX56_ECHGR|nr:hypothetical protein EgrG_001103700 [Echinococcus granulosus]